MISASEYDILDSKSLRALSVFWWGIGVLTNTEEIVKGNTDEVIDGLSMRTWMVEA